MPAKLGIIFVNFFGGLDLMDQFRGTPAPFITYKRPQRQEGQQCHWGTAKCSK
uniref:Uncharacterized protein n=1 Tax=Anguilla anguilla TaxID=7936 RepID=A0A0E9TFQ3_ANGAN